MKIKTKGRATDGTVATNGHRRRFAPLMWMSGALAAGVMVLGVTGTLSSWTQAIISNDTNTAKAADSVILQETGPDGAEGTAVCNSTDNADGTNSYTCSTINKYGGATTPLDPETHTSQSVTVTMKNTGTTDGELVLDPGTCDQTLGSPTASESICDVATVTVVCDDPSTLDTTATPVALSDFGHQDVVATLEAGASTACTFTVALPESPSPQIAGQLASQPLDWTLTAAPAPVS